jgi:uncharacterized protein YdeI (YjbR/CyaY-like superfamily)
VPVILPIPAMVGCSAPIWGSDLARRHPDHSYWGTYRWLVVNYERVHPETPADWRAWLEEHHDRSLGVRLVQWRTATGRRRLSYHELVEEALCFGWIDSRADRLDDDRSMIVMTPRRPTGVWSRTNKERVKRLIDEGRMTAAGLRAVEIAKANGSWVALDDVEALIVPDDLLAALASNDRAQHYFEACTPSAKKMILYWIKSAKRTETRRRRIEETVRMAADNRRPGSRDR